MKKLIFTLLVCIAVLCSCSGGNLTPFIQTSDGYDFGGYEFTFLTQDFGYTENTVYSDAVLKRIDEVEKLLNCTIIQDNSDFFTSMSTALSGDTDFEAAQRCNYSGMKEIRSYMKAGSLLSLSSDPDVIGFIDYTDTEKWGGRDQLSCFAWDGELYAVVPYTWPTLFFNIADFALYTNTQMISSIIDTDPREYIENKTWTREKFEELIGCLTTQNAGGEKIYSLTTHGGHFFDITLRTSVPFVIKDDSGNYSSGFHTNEGLKALTWASDLMFGKYKDNIWIQETFPAIATFIEKGAAMVLTHSGFALGQNTGSISFDSDFDFGILPFPLADSMEQEKWIGQHEYMCYYICIPAAAKEPDKAAAIINELFKPLEGFETEEIRNKWYETYLVYNSADLKIINTMIQNSQYNFYEEGARSLADAIASNEGNLSVSELMERHKNPYESVMEKEIIPVYEACDALWGK